MRTPHITAVAVCIAAVALAWSAQGDAWWNHVRTLADDRFEGRGAGTEGYRKAAEYVAQEFERAGLKAAGTDGYFQPVRFDVRQLLEDRSRLELIDGGKAEPLTLGDHAIVSVRGVAGGDVEAAAVFVGYGLQIPEAHHDDFVGLDLAGKIAVYYSGGPKNVSGALRSHYSSMTERRKVLRRLGAVGAAVIQRPDYDVPWPRAALRRFQPALSLPAPDSPGFKLFLTINPVHADLFLAGSGHTFSEILEADKAGRPLPRFALARKLRAKIVMKDSSAESHNVVALMPGTDRKLRNEYVVLSAHLDGLGIGSPIGGDSIYNGAMDNASGVASLIEIARLLRQSGVELKRSVLFLAVTAEEQGLLGSQFFARDPTVRGDRIVANINLDMFMPLTPLQSIEVQGLDESTLGDAIRAVGKQAGIDVMGDREPERNLFIRSDQYNFIRRGVPALAFKFGYDRNGPEAKVYKDWLKERYHAPSDDTAQPVDTAAAAQFNRVIQNLIERVANAAERPRWNQSSFFRRFEK